MFTFDGDDENTDKTSADNGKVDLHEKSSSRHVADRAADVADSFLHFITVKIDVPLKISNLFQEAGT